MAQLNYSADYNNANENNFEPLPAGDYVAMIVDSEMKTTKNNDGQYLKLTWKIVDGPQNGKQLFENLNIVNRNQQAQQIAEKSLNAICLACNMKNVQDSAQLHGIPMSITVGVRGKETDEYGIQNTIKKHSAISGQPNTQVQQDQMQQQASQQQGSSSGKPAWVRE